MNTDMHLGDLKERFIHARPKVNVPDGWQSPFMLLGGALFSMGCANTDPNMSIDNVMYDMEPGTWNDVFDQVRQFAIDPDSDRWIHLWYSSYMLTNGLFRIAAATEKICTLCSPEKKSGRQGMWVQIKDPGSALNRALPAARGFLGEMPKTWDERGQVLRDMRAQHDVTGKVDHPLMYTVIQADTDKHVPYRPVKEIRFEWQLAIGGFVEALTLWEQALKAHETGLLA